MLPDGGFIIAHSKGDCNESTATFTVWCRFGNSFFAFTQKGASLRGFAADLAGIEFPQHTVGGQQVQRHRGHMLKAAGGLVPELRVMALQRELLAHLLQHRAAALGLGLGLPLLNTILRAVLETRGLTDGKAFQYMAYYRTALGALPNLLAALALFYLFKGLDLGCVRWVNALAGTTLGVYILHQVPAFRGFLWNSLLQAEAHHGSVGYTRLAILAVFLGCAAVDALRTALVMRPLENTHLFKALCEKGDALAAKITADD